MGSAVATSWLGLVAMSTVPSNTLVLRSATWPRVEPSRPWPKKSLKVWPGHRPLSEAVDRDAGLGDVDAMQRQADPLRIGQDGLRRVEGDARLAVRHRDVHRHVLRQAGAVGRRKARLEPNFVGLPVLEAGHAEIPPARLQAVVDAGRDVDIGREAARFVAGQGRREGETGRGHRPVRLHGHIEVIDRIGLRRPEQGGSQEQTLQSTPDDAADHLSASHIDRKPATLIELRGGERGPATAGTRSEPTSRVRAGSRWAHVPGWTVSRLRCTKTAVARVRVR